MIQRELKVFVSLPRCRVSASYVALYVKGLTDCTRQSVTRCRALLENVTTWSTSWSTSTQTQTDPVTACDGTMHMIKRATGCQLCIVRRSLVYLVQVICTAAAQPHAVCFSDLPVSNLAACQRSRVHVISRMCANTLECIQGPPA